MPNVITNTAEWADVPLEMTTERAYGANAAHSQSLQEASVVNKAARALTRRTQALYEGKISGPRNSVLMGATTAGVPNFGTFATKILTITGASTPLLLNFAQGVSSFGTKETVVSYTGTATIDYTASTSGQQYLVFAVWSGTAVSFVSVEIGADIPYHVQATAPSTIAGDQFYFNTAANKMYREIGAAWVAVDAILIGGVRIPGSGGEFTMKPYGTPCMSIDAPCGAIYAWHAATAAPTGWALCDGSSKYVDHFIELFNVIGTTYGGSGLSFTLPTVTNSIIKLY